MPDTIATAIGWSEHADAARAGREAAEAALEKLASAKPTLALVFGSSWFDQGALLKGVRLVLQDVPLAGASTAGEILPHGPVSHHCVVLLIAAEALACSVGMSEALDDDPRQAGHHAASTALHAFAGNQRAGFLLFGDGLVTSYAEVVRGLQEVLGTSSLIVGAMAGDDLRFARTYQYAGHRVLSHALVGVLLGGAVKLGVGIEHGFAPISKPRRITRAHANLLYELDGHPAASVYEEYFGGDLVSRMQQEGLSRQAIAYPLGIQREATEERLLRNVVSFGEGGSLQCTGEMFEGAWLQLMIGSRERALDAAHRAAQHAVRSLNHVACALVFDSVLRRTFLGPHHAAVEIARIRDAVGASTPLLGCYTYGEQAPVGGSSTAEQSATQTGSVLVVTLGT